VWLTHPQWLMRMTIWLPQQKNHDLTSLSTYAGMLSTDNRTAIDDSDLYNVSPDLQGAKDEYLLSLVHSKAAAIYIIYGVEAYNKGNNTAASSDLAQASQYMNSSDKHAHRAASLLKVESL
jgi:hypothetical protein